MVLLLSIVPWLLCSIYNLALSHCQVKGTVHCLSTQFGVELCLPTIWVLHVYLHKCGMVVSLNNSGGYLCITAIWRYCTAYYCTDGMYHDWYLKSCFLSASQGMLGNNNVSLHNSGVELCIPTIWVLHVYLHNYLRFQKLGSHRSSVSRHVLIDIFCAYVKFMYP